MRNLFCAAGGVFLLAGCSAEEQKVSSLKDAAPLHIELKVIDRPSGSMLDGVIMTSLPYDENGCMLDGGALSVVVNGSTGAFLVSAGGPSEGKCIPAKFDDFNVLWNRTAQNGLDHVEIWDDPNWKVRLEGQGIFENRAWELGSQDPVRPGARLEGRWSHPGDDLSGAIVSIEYLVNRRIDDPERGAFRIAAEDIKIDGSSFFFTVPEVLGGTLGRLTVEVSKLPLVASCTNATCDVYLEGEIYKDNVRVYP